MDPSRRVPRHAVVPPPCSHRGRRRDERGASFVEFALILPVFFAIALAALTGGVSFERKLAIAHAARESSRYGATRPVDPQNNGGMTAWLTAVADAVEQTADGAVDSSEPTRDICVAYVYPQGATGGDRTAIHRRGRSGPVTDTAASAGCFTDGLPADARRVQVVVSRDSSFQAFFFTRTVSLEEQSVTRFEAVPG